MPTIEFDAILCSVSFSDISANALRQASVLADCMNSRLMVAYTNSFEVPPYFAEAEN